MPVTLVPPALLRQWWIFLAGALVAWGGGLTFLWVSCQSPCAWRWGLPAAFAGGWVLYRLRANLRRNHRPGDTRVLAGFGPATVLTFLRGMAIAAVAGFALPLTGKTETVSWLAWTPGIFYLVAAAADWIDGYVARSMDCETRLGEVFDTETDALGILVASTVAVTHGRVPTAYLSVGIAYYAMQTAILVRNRAGKPVFPIAPWSGARLIAGFQMGFIGIALLPVLSPAVTTTTAWVFMIPLLGGFARDWLVCRGLILPETDRRASGLRQVGRVVSRWLPVILRGLGLVFLGALLTWAAAVTDLSAAASWATVSLIACVALVVVGFVGRAAAILTGLITGCMVTIGVFAPAQWPLALIAWAGVLMQSGTGMWSLWQPEARWLAKKAGVPKVRRLDSGQNRQRF